MDIILDRIVNSLYSEDNYEKSYSKIYKIHKYWARKPWYIVEKYIKGYSKPGEIVMDPFCGSGTTGLEAVINGRNFIGQDLNPSALLITRGTLKNNINFDSLIEDIDNITKNCKSEIMKLYAADQHCERCNNQMYFKFINIGPKFKGEYTGGIYCSNCNSRTVKRKLTKDEVIKMNSYSDLRIKYWVPTVRFPSRFYKDRFTYKGIFTVADMYTKRNLYALSLLLESIKSLVKDNKELILLAFTNTVLHVSKLKGENVRPLGVNNYWVPADYFEENVWFRFEDRIRILVESKRQQAIRERSISENPDFYGDWKIENKSALLDMGKECVDYFFTDPPYGDAIQYSELSFVWNAWINDFYDNEEEVIINPMQDKGVDEFQNLLYQSLNNIHRALKNERYFTLCFQNKSFEIWESVIDYCKKIGLQLVDVSVYNTYGNSFNKNWAKFSPKSDIYVTFKKTKVAKERFYNRTETLEEIIKKTALYMEHKNVNLDNNKLYDYSISYLIWAMYLNEYKIDVKGFDIKKFAKIAQEVLRV